MSFNMRFYRYDHQVMLLGVGSGDAGIKSAVDQEFASQTVGHEADSEWHREFELGRQLAHEVIDQSFPVRSGKEELRHRLAAEWLTTVFHVPGFCDAADWRWRAFYDTIHTVPGFGDPIAEIIDFLDEGRPFFGSECPDEAHYGYLTYDESARFLAQCHQHRAAFEADDDARHCIGRLIELFAHATKERYHLWFGFS